MFTLCYFPMLFLPVKLEGRSHYNLGILCVCSRNVLRRSRINCRRRQNRLEMIFGFPWRGRTHWDLHCIELCTAKGVSLKSLQQLLPNKCQIPVKYQWYIVQILTTAARAFSSTNGVTGCLNRYLGQSGECGSERILY
jgi:hypothetical protein